MRTIKTNETLFKVMKETNGTLYFTPSNYQMSQNGCILNDNGELIQEVDYYTCARVIGMENRFKLHDGEELKLKLNELPSYQRELERKEKHEQRKQAAQRRLEAYEAIEYFKGWQEGDTITITGDFVKNVEAIAEYLESLKK